MIWLGKKSAFSLNAKEKKACLALARKSIDYFFQHRDIWAPAEEELKGVPSKLKKEKACFVTLMIAEPEASVGKGGSAGKGASSGKKKKSFRGKKLRLRGCIGHLQSIQSLYKDIIENAVSAAFNDMRFSALIEWELPRIKIEVSVLTDPEPLKYANSADLLKKIKEGKDGLIIKKGYFSATFLPSVWEELKSKEDFLSHLCAKAGLSPDEWRKGELEVQRYYAIKAKEK